MNEHIEKERTRRQMVARDNPSLGSLRAEENLLIGYYYGILSYYGFFAMSSMLLGFIYDVVELIWGFSAYPLVVVLSVLWVLFTVMLVYSAATKHQYPFIAGWIFFESLDEQQIRRVSYPLAVLGVVIIVANLFGLFSLADVADNFSDVAIGFGFFLLIICGQGFWISRGKVKKIQERRQIVKHEEIMSELYALRNEIQDIRKALKKTKE